MSLYQIDICFIKPLLGTPLSL